MPRNKKLREQYLENDEAAQFMQDHPEMFGWDAESTHDRPGNAQWACTEPSPDRLEQAHMIQEALLTYPDSRIKSALDMYYDGMKIEDIQKFLGHEKKHSTIRFIWKSKKTVLIHKANMKRKKLNLKHRRVVAKNTFKFEDDEKAVYLIYTPRSKKYVWVDSDNRILHDDIQDFLDKELIKEGKFYDESVVFEDDTK